VPLGCIERCLDKRRGASLGTTMSLISQRTHVAACHNTKEPADPRHRRSKAVTSIPFPEIYCVSAAYPKNDSCDVAGRSFE
jgi:hypothetical protein